MRYTNLKRLFKKIRYENHITQTLMAKRLGISQPVLSFYENSRANIPIHTVEDIISQYRLSKEDAEFLRSQRITRDNQKAIEVLTELQYTLVTNQQDNGYADEQVDLYELLELIENKINKLKGG